MYTATCRIKRDSSYVSNQTYFELTPENVPRVQKFDWLKDMTPEEEALMVAREWDTEGVALGPIEHRYKQPALRVREDEHEQAMREARTALRCADSYNEGDAVRCFSWRVRYVPVA